MTLHGRDYWQQNFSTLLLQQHQAVKNENEAKPRMVTVFKRLAAIPQTCRAPPPHSQCPSPAVLVTYLPHFCNFSFLQHFFVFRKKNKKCVAHQRLRDVENLSAHSSMLIPLHSIPTFCDAHVHILQFVAFLVCLLFMPHTLTYSMSMCSLVQLKYKCVRLHFDICRLCQSRAKFRVPTVGYHSPTIALTVHLHELDKHMLEEFLKMFLIVLLCTKVCMQLGVLKCAQTFQSFQPASRNNFTQMRMAD